MQIHELNTFSGTPGENDYLATDNGTDTSKIPIPSITADSLHWRRLITSADNLNNILDDGIYFWTSVANTPTNAPWSGNGMLIVSHAKGRNETMQLAAHMNVVGSSRFTYRVRSSSQTWSSWYYNVLTTSSSTIDGIITSKSALTASNDLDSVTTNGVYWYPDSAIPAHSPYTYGGVVLVFGSTSTTTQKIQMFIGYGADGNQGMAYRSMAGGTWHIWKYVDVGYESTGKYLSILGDSISTYTGFVPTGEGYATYYTGSNCGVSSVNQTWWKRLLNATGMQLLVNNSVSGACISTAARQDRKSGCLPERTGALGDGTHTPDYIIVYMGINDWYNSVPMGDFDGSQTFPTTTLTLRDAFAVTLKAIQTNYPDAKLFVCTTEHTSASVSSASPIHKVNGVTQPELNEVIRDVARMFNCEIIDFERCGITAGNVSSNTGDGANLHPNASGHKLMFKEALRHFK